MGLLKSAKAAWYSVPAELSKGALKGQLIRLSDPARYRQLKSIRPDRKQLVAEKKRLVGLIRAACKSGGINLLKVYGRVKTLGSLDRKVRYGKKMYSGHAEEFSRDDLIGLTIVVKSERAAHSVLDALKTIGDFPKLPFRDNPRDYFRHAEKVRRPEVILSEAITGNFRTKGIEGCLTHIKICTEKSQSEETQNRGLYKKKIWKKIRGK